MSTAGQGRVPLRAHRRAVARRGVPRAGHGLPLDGARHDPLGRRRRARRRSRCCRPCSSRSATRCSSRAARRTPTSSPRAAGPAGPASRCAGPAPCSRSASCCSALLDRPGARDAPRHARRPRRRPGPHQPRRLRHARRRRSAPAPPRPRSSPSPPPTPTPWSTIATGRPRRRRRPRRHRARARPAASSCASSPDDRRSTTRAPPTWSTRCATGSTTAVPDARGRRTRRAEPRPHRRAHRSRAATRSASSSIVAFVLLLVVFRSLVDRARSRS